MYDSPDYDLSWGYFTVAESHKQDDCQYAAIPYGYQELAENTITNAVKAPIYFVGDANNPPNYNCPYSTQYCGWHCNSAVAANCVSSASETATSAVNSNFKNPLEFEDTTNTKDTKTVCGSAYTTPDSYNPSVSKTWHGYVPGTYASHCQQSNGIAMIIRIN